MRTTLSLIIPLFISLSVFAQKVAIIPKPVSMATGSGSFTLSAATSLVVPNDADRNAAIFFKDYVQQYLGFALNITREKVPNSIIFSTRQHIAAPKNDGYSFHSSNSGITINGETGAGTFYGMQTLIQLLPITSAPGVQSVSIPAVKITDEPRFVYRGMHLDVSRHMFPLAFIKRYIDYLALHKMNVFHWHLTDDQGWRIEIKKYPELASRGAWRNGTIIGRYPGTGNDNQRYGGFYTQEEVKEVVQYAADRFITVVPEIEMPGHASAAIAAFPWLSCFPEKDTEIPHHPSTASKNSKGKKVQETFGVFEDIFCAGKDSTFLFLQDVVDEVLPLFPSKYFHVGGDEAPKEHWQQCPRCQARIKAEGLKDEHGLQSYFIQRMEKYLNAKGKTIIGWDEILEGGLAPNAIVMSWRGEAGGIAAAKDNHQVIMTPGSHVYFDHSQSSDEDSVTIGGFTPIEKVYRYEPIPKELNEAQAKYVLGAQANLWTEYVRYPQKVEYMIFPRISALSEVLWSSKTARNWTDFEQRLQTQFLRFNSWGVNWSKAYFDIAATVHPAPGNKGLQVKLSSKDKAGKITFGIGGVQFQKNYTAPITINQTSDITALYNRNGQVLDSVTVKLKFNKATGKKVTLNPAPAPNYPGDGAFTLVNGIVNSKGMARSAEFIGYNGKPATFIVDLGTVQPIESVITHALSAGGSWVYPPQEMEVSLSNDGKTYKRMGTAREFNGITPQKGTLEVFAAAQQGRFIKIVLKPVEKIGSGLPGAGNAAWMFVDEIEVR
jgi:hexosaminidase